MSFLSIPNLPPWLQRLSWCLIACLCLWLCLAALHHAMHRPLTFDDVIYALPIKDWLAGHGWGTHYDEFIPFNSDVSTGLTLLLPVGLLMAAFGNFYAAPALAATLTNLLLLGLLLWRLQRFLPARASVFVAALSVALLCPQGHLLNLSGYGTTWILIALGATLLADARIPAPRRYLLFGLIIGLVAHAKLLGILALGSMLATALLLHLRESRPAAAASTAKAAAWAIAGAALLILPWHIIKAAALSQETAETLALRSAYSQRFFLYHGSGIGNLLDAPDLVTHVLKTAGRNVGILCRYLETLLPLPAWIPLLTWCLSGILAIWRCGMRPNNLNTLLLLLWTGSLAHGCWFLFFAFTYYGDKSLFAVMPGLLLIVLTAFSLLPQRWAPLLSAALLLTVAAQQHDAWRPLLQGQVSEENQRLRAAEQDILAYMHHGLPRDIPWAGCGYSLVPRRLQYLWPETHLFRDCYNLIEDHLTFDDDAYLRQHPDVAALVERGDYASGREHFYRSGWKESRQGHFNWQDAPNFYLFVDIPLAIFSGNNHPAAMLVGKACQQHAIFNNDAFIVLHCSSESLRRHLDVNAFMRHLIESHTWYRTRLRAL